MDFLLHLLILIDIKMMHHLIFVIPIIHLDPPGETLEFLDSNFKLKFEGLNPLSLQE